MLVTSRRLLELAPYVLHDVAPLPSARPPTGQGSTENRQYRKPLVPSPSTWCDFVWAHRSSGLTGREMGRSLREPPDSPAEFHVERQRVAPDYKVLQPVLGSTAHHPFPPERLRPRPGHAVGEGGEIAPRAEANLKTGRFPCCDPFLKILEGRWHEKEARGGREKVSRPAPDRTTPSFAPSCPSTSAIAHSLPGFRHFPTPFATISPVTPNFLFFLCGKGRGRG